MRRACGSIFVQISSAKGISSSPCDVSTSRSGVPANPSPGNWTSRTVPSRAGASPSEHGEDARTGGVVGVSNTLQPIRSEEHTSELQSRFDLVCRLLLEKKKKR